MGLWINGRKVYDTPYVLGTITLVNGDIDLSTSGTGVYDIILKDAVADALSIRRATTDMMVFDSSTPKITITPNLTLVGQLIGPSGFIIDQGAAGGVSLVFGTGQTISIRGSDDTIRFTFEVVSSNAYVQAATGSLVLYSSSGIHLDAGDTNGVQFGKNDDPADIIGAMIKIVTVTVTYTGTLFDAVGLTDSANIWQQPANSIVLNAKAVLNTQFAATGMTDLDVTVGDAGNNAGILNAAMNLTSDATTTQYKTKGAYFDATAGTLLKEAATQWIAYATAVGANLSTLTAGSVSFYFTYLQL